MSDIIRAGYISSVNYTEGTAQVVYKDRDNSTSSFMPFWSNEYAPPEIDTLVYVLHLPNGGTRGMILVPPYTEGRRPLEGRKGLWRKDFGDGSYIRYDHDKKQMDIVCSSVYTESLNIAGRLVVEGTISAESVTVSGNVHVGGNLTVSGEYPV